MNVTYFPVLQRAWERARALLFTPFRFETWLVLGLAAFLSEWLSGGWGHSGFQSHVQGHHGHIGAPFAFLAHPIWGPLAVTVALTVALIVLVCQWLGARGKFVFLDDVVRRRAAIGDPWTRYAALGDSLFFWKLGVLIVAGLLIGGILLTAAGAAILAAFGLHAPVAAAPPIAAAVTLLAIIALLVAFVMLLTDDFVVPIMYRDGLRAMAAWRRFLPLLRREPGLFVLYALFVLVLSVIVWAIVAAVGVATCCVGFLLVGLPYVGQVVLLPVYVTFRALGPEFLAQFGPEYDIFAAAQPGGGAVPPSTPGGSAGPPPSPGAPVG